MDEPMIETTDRIEKRVDLKAPIEKVWRALTDHEQFGEWFGVKLEAPFAVGESARGYITNPGYEHVRFESPVVAMEPMRRFAFNWRPHAVEQGRDYSGEPHTLVEFILEPTPGGTRLTVVESGFDAIPAYRREAAFHGNSRGWGQQMENIRAYVEP